MCVVCVILRRSIGFFVLCESIRCVCCACSCMFHNDDFELQFYELKHSNFGRPNIIPFHDTSMRRNKHTDTHTRTHRQREVHASIHIQLLTSPRAMPMDTTVVAVVWSNLTTKLSNSIRAKNVSLFSLVYTFFDHQQFKNRIECVNSNRQNATRLRLFFQWFYCILEFSRPLFDKFTIVINTKRLSIKYQQKTK